MNIVTVEWLQVSPISSGHWTESKELYCTWCWFIWFYFSVYLCATYVVAVYPYVYCVLGSSKSEIKPSSLLGQLAVPPMFEVFEGYMYTRRCNAKGSKKALCTGQDISHSGKKNVQVPFPYLVVYNARNNMRLHCIS